MNEQPAQESTGLMTPVKRLIKAVLVLIRLLVAFACGWLFTFLLFGDGPDPVLFFSQLWLFLCLSVVPALTVGRRNKHRITLAVGTGLLALAGIYTYELPLVIQEDADASSYCADHYCHVGGGLNTFALTFGLLVCSILMVLGSVITILIRKMMEEDPLFPPS